MGIVYELRDVDDAVLYVGQTSPNPGHRLTHHLRYQPWAAEVRSMVFAHVDVDPASILLLERRHAAERAPKYGNWSSAPKSKLDARPILSPVVKFTVCPAAVRLAATRCRRSVQDLAVSGAIPADWVPRVRSGFNFLVPVSQARMAAARLDLPESELTCSAGMR